MTTVVPLDKGFKIGDIEHREAEIREATSEDVIQATVAAERLVMVPTGYDRDGAPVLTPQLVPSPTLVGVNVLRRRIVRIGTVQAPIDDLYFNILSPEDLNILQRAADAMDGASVVVTHRGRSDRSGEDSSQGD